MTLKLVELTKEHEEVSTRLKALRELMPKIMHGLGNSEEKKLLAEQEHYMAEYVRTLNRRITLETFP